MDKKQENLMAGFAFLSILNQSKLNNKLQKVNEINNKLLTKQDILISNQNRLLSQAERQLDILQEQQLHQERQRELKQLAFEFDNELKKIESYEDNFSKYYVLSFIKKRISAGRIDTSSFDEISDKKYFQELYERLNSDISTLLKSLPEETNQFFYSLDVSLELRKEIIPLTLKYEALKTDIASLSKKVYSFSLKSIIVCMGCSLLLVLISPLGFNFEYWFYLFLIFMSGLGIFVINSKSKKLQIAEKESAINSFKGEINKLKSRLNSAENNIRMILNKHHEWESVKIEYEKYFNRN